VIETTEYYDSHISDKTQRWTPKLVIDYSDYNIDNTITATVDQPNDVSIDDQIADGIKEPSFKFWNWEDFEWGMHIYDSNKNYEQGAISQQLSAEDRTFSESSGAFYGAAFYGAGFYSEIVQKPSFTVSFSERPVTSLEVVFDSLIVHYAEDFTIDLYEGSSVVYTETVTGNSGTLWNKTLDTSYDDITSMKVTIDKWNVKNSPARVLEFYTSVQETYYEDDIISFSISEESTPDKASVPIGNVTANSCEISLVNKDSYFDNDNEDSPLQNNLVKNRRISPYIGLVGDLDETGKQNYIPLGVFYSQSWTNDNYEAIASADGLDIVQLMNDNSYDTSQTIIAPEDQVFEYTTTADFEGFSLNNAIAENDKLSFGGEPWVYSSIYGAFYGQDPRIEALLDEDSLSILDEDGIEILGVEHI
jgi:hypothetical protein